MSFKSIIVKSNQVTNGHNKKGKTKQMLKGWVFDILVKNLNPIKLTTS